MNVFECYNEIDVLSLADKFRVFLRSSHDCEKKASRDELRALVDLRTELKVDDSVFKKPLRKFFSNMAKEAEFTNEVHLLIDEAGIVMKDMKVFDGYEVKELDGQAKVCLNALRKYYEGVRDSFNLYSTRIEFHLKSGTVINDKESFAILHDECKFAKDFIFSTILARVQKYHNPDDDYRGTNCIMRKSDIVGISVEILKRENDFMDLELYLNNPEIIGDCTVVTKAWWEDYGIKRSKQPVGCSEFDVDLSAYN